MLLVEFDLVEVVFGIEVDVFLWYLFYVECGVVDVFV